MRKSLFYGLGVLQVFIGIGAVAGARSSLKQSIGVVDAARR
jgi:hypothetical protein